MDSEAFRLPQVKFGHVSRLAGQPNYHQWASAAKIYLPCTECWKIVTRTENRPTTTAGDTTKDPKVLLKEQTAWDRKNNVAHAFLVGMVEPEFVELITNCDTAAEAWRALKDRFDRQNATAFHGMLAQLVSLRMDPSTSMKDHLTAFDTFWTRFRMRTQASKDSEKLVRLFKPVGDSDEAKAAFHLLSLPSSLSHVVDNLQTKDNLTYSDTYQKLLDLNSTNSDIHPTESQAFIVKGRPQGKQKKGKKLENQQNTHCSSTSSQS